jgi:hypothetical protein
MPSDRYVSPYTQPTVLIQSPNDTPDNIQDATSLASRAPFYASSSSSELNAQRSARLAAPHLLYPPSCNQSTTSVCSTASNTPAPSRPTSPSYTQDDEASSCSSESEENELDSSVFLRSLHRQRVSVTNDVPRWWWDGPLRRRRRFSWYRLFRRYILPFIPKTPLTIVSDAILLYSRCCQRPVSPRFLHYCASLPLLFLWPILSYTFAIPINNLCHGEATARCLTTRPSHRLLSWEHTLASPFDHPNRSCQSRSHPITWTLFPQPACS